MKSAIIAIGLIEDYNNNIGAETHNLFKTQLLLEKYVHACFRNNCMYTFHKASFSQINLFRYWQDKGTVSKKR